MRTSLADLPKIEPWLRQRGCVPEGIESLAGDVSARRYFRVFTKAESTILAYYPPGLADSHQRFLATTTLLENAGVPVPRILATDPTASLVWLEDLGPESLHDCRSKSWSEIIPQLSRALDYRRTILGLQRREVERLNPRLDGPSLNRELDPVFELLLLPHGFLRDADLARRFRLFASQICETLGRAPSAPCHRDYMARNLMVQDDRLIVIDHQDLRIAPAVYDLASLLNDSLFPPLEVEHSLLETALGTREEARHYHLATVQRTLKAAGTFASFAKRGQLRHLELIGPTLSRTLSHLSRLEEGRDWSERLESRWSDLLEEHFPSSRS